MNKQSRQQVLLEKYRKIIADRVVHRDQPVSKFCRSHNISVWTYYHWKKKILALSSNPADSIKADQSFLHVALPAPEHLSNFYEIRFGALVQLKIMAGFRKEEVSVLVDILSERCR